MFEKERDRSIEKGRGGETRGRELKRKRIYDLAKERPTRINAIVKKVQALALGR